VDQPPKGDVGDLYLAHHVRILRLQDGLQQGCVVLLRELQLENQGVCLPSNGLLRVSNNAFGRKQANHILFNIKFAGAAAHLSRIPGTTYYYVNNTIDPVMFNRFWPKPPEAEGDMQTDDDTARPEVYRRNRITSVDEEEADEEEE